MTPRSRWSSRGSPSTQRRGDAVAATPQRVTYEATIERIDEIAPDTRSFVLRLPPAPHFAFRPGQFISCLLPVGGELIRPYSIASDPEDGVAPRDLPQSRPQRAGFALSVQPRGRRDACASPDRGARSSWMARPPPSACSSPRAPASRPSGRCCGVPSRAQPIRCDCTTAPRARHICCTQRSSRQRHARTKTSRLRPCSVDR